MTSEVAHECEGAYLTCLQHSRRHQDYFNATTRMSCSTRAPLEEMLRAFLEAGASPNDALTGGRRPMRYAMVSHNVELVKVLFEYKADPDLTDARNLCPWSFPYSPRTT